MKLRTKIFISILLVSLTALLISSSYLIHQSHQNNVMREQERSLNEFTFLLSSIESGIDFEGSADNITRLFSRYCEYYAQRGIRLASYRNKKALYNGITELSEASYHSMLSVEAGTRKAYILKENGQHYFMVTGRLAKYDDVVLVYAREISGIYQLRVQSIYLSLLLTALLILLLSFLSYLYSRWITKPIVLLNQSAKSISQGDYSVRVPQTKDEFQVLGAAFNHMATAVEVRTSELQERAKELQVFIDDLSHEMNTPLTSIQGYSEFLLSANATQEQKQKAAETIKTEALRMKDIYTKLMALTLAREQEPEKKPVNINDLFHNLKATFSPLLTEHNIKLELHNELDNLLLDKTLIHMLLGNLIKNSIFALPSGGIIHLNAYTKDQRAVLEVTDNGYGIPKEKIDEVMKPFYRVDKSRSRKTGGAGLGLSICQSIAKLHSAELVIESEEGKGTSVKVVFYNSVTTSSFH